MIGVFVTSAGLLIANADLVWIGAHDPEDRIEWQLYDFLDSGPSPSGGWHYFAGSECLEWNEESYGCLARRTQVELVPGVAYDLVAWSEAEDIRDPDRELVPVAGEWVFESADIDMDGAVDCGDLVHYAMEMYDWNADGEVTAGDVEELRLAMTVVRADFNGDGLVNEADFLTFYTDWGCTAGPGALCVGDLNCNGETGVEDLLLLLTACGL
jgi:hypothetical protein